MLKAPSVNPWTYISRYPKRDPREGHFFFTLALLGLKICSKKFQNKKKGGKWYMPEKKRSTKMLYAHFKSDKDITENA